MKRDAGQALDGAGIETCAVPAWRGSVAVDAIATLAGALASLPMVDRTASALPLAAAVLWWAVVVRVIRSDVENFIIPDSCSIAIAVLGLVQAVAGPMADHAGIAATLAGAGAALATGVAGFVLFWLLGLAARRVTGREALGFGDVKLAGASAIWLNPGDAGLAVEVAALAAIALLLVRGRRGPVREVAVPFGAFLAPAAWAAFVFGPALHDALGLLR